MNIKTIISISLIICVLGLPVILYAQGVKDTTIKVNNDIELIRINKSFYIHTTWFDFPGFGRFSSNGLIYIKNGKALLIDTPASNKQTKELHNYMKDSMEVEITKVIVGHYHDDCLGGLEYLHELGITSISNYLTKKKCVEYGLPIPSNTFVDKMIFDFEGEKVICKYFGGGHTIDNIVIFFPEKKVLFGGCLIKSKDSKGLGNTKDAVIKEWDNSVKKIMKEYEDINIVVPGHGLNGNKELLTHTINLVKKHKEK